MTCARCCGWRRNARLSRVPRCWTATRYPHGELVEPSTPESGQRAGHDGHKREKGSKLHTAVDTLGHLIALHVTPANTDDRTQVGKLAEAVQAVTGDSVDLAYVDEDYTGDRPAAAAEKQGIKLEMVRLSEAKRGFVLLPRRWVVERSFAWATRFRRLGKDYEGYTSTFAGLHLLAFVYLMLENAALCLPRFHNAL